MKEKIEDSYPEIVKDVMEYIIKVKKENISVDISLIDIIGDYCFHNDLEVELVGDAIRSDNYFSSFIEKDCKSRNIIRKGESKKEEW